MNAYVPLRRRCTDCGAVDQTIMIVTASGDTLCGSCWEDTTRISCARQPKTAALDAHMRRVEAREASR